MSIVPENQHNLDADSVDDDLIPEFDGEAADAFFGTGKSDDSEATQAKASGLTATQVVLHELQLYFDSQRDGMVAASHNEIIARCTRAYLAALDVENPPAPNMLEQQLLDITNATIKQENQKIAKEDGRAGRLRQLTYWQVAQVLLKLHHVVRIAPSSANTDREYDVLGFYVNEGSDNGTYSTSEDDVRTVARRYNTALTLNEFKEVLAVLREDAPRVHKCSHPDLVAVNNGVVFYGVTDAEIEVGGKQFSFNAKRLHPFDPAMIFTSKARVDYVEDAPEQIITHPDTGEKWDVVSWVNDLSDDEGVPELLWEILGAIVRPHVRWNKSAWFYSDRGNNGKGTLCSLARDLLGGASASIPLALFNKNFALEPLLHSNAIIVDENPVGSFIDQAAELKAVVTGDLIQIDRKHRTPVAFQFSGFVIQCLNDLPRAKDKSDSFYRRQLFVPFKKWFGGGAEKKYIKGDYLKRREVLEYALWYVINRAGAATPGNYYELSEPPATKALGEEYKEANDPVLTFWNEFREEFEWDLLPFVFLYDLYKSWFQQMSPNGKCLSSQVFIGDLMTVLRDDNTWECPDKTAKQRPGQRMSRGEPLIAEYNLDQWKDPTYTGKDRHLIGRPLLKAAYRGVQRRPNAPAAGTWVAVTTPTDTEHEGAL